MVAGVGSSRARWLGVVAVALGVAAPTLVAAQNMVPSRPWSEISRPQRLTKLPDFSELAKRVVPAVVSIRVEQKPRRVARGGHHDRRRFQDPNEFFRRFFGAPYPEQNEHPGRRGIGTGFVISKNGMILTNNHVIEDADVIEVVFDGGEDGERVLEAKVLGTAPEYDVALLQTKEDAEAPTISYLGDSDVMEIGDWVMAVGNPFGLSHSVSVGIISAKERRQIAPSGRQGLYNFIQTDASINPGNSGGPLINTRGEVIGINTAINAQGSGIGFAIPINMVKSILPDLKSKGHFTRSWIGIRIQSLTKELAETYGLKGLVGALVSEVVDGGPAEDAGMQDGDVILLFNGKKVKESSDLPLLASAAGVSAKVRLVVWRDGRRKTLKVTLGEYPDDGKTASSSTKNGKRPSEILGMNISDIDVQLRRMLRIERSNGVVVTEIAPNSVAARTGVRAGDVLLKINGSTIKRSADVFRAIEPLKKGAVLRLQIDRRGGRLFVAIRKP